MMNLSTRQYTYRSKTTRHTKREACAPKSIANFVVESTMTRMIPAMLDPVFTEMETFWIVRKN